MLTKHQQKHLDDLAGSGTFSFPETFSYSSSSGKIFPFGIDISKSYRKSIQDITSKIQKTFEFDVIVSCENKGDCFSRVIGPWLDKDDAVIKGNQIKGADLTDKRVLFMGDIIYTGYSMVNSWIPTIENNNGKIIGAYFYINEKEGRTLMKELEIPYKTLIKLNSNAWEYLHKKGIFTKNQYKEISEWREDKDAWAFKTLTSEKGLIQLLEWYEGSLSMRKIKTKILRAYPQYKEKILEKMDSVIDNI